MASISEILVQDDFGRIVSDLCVDTIENREPREYLEEYNGSVTVALHPLVSVNLRQ